MTKLNSALALAQQGHRVFPLGINAKVPALDGNWQKLATTDPDRIRQLWSCPVFGDPIDYNIGIAIGPTTVVIDVDVRDGKRGAESLRLWEAINGDLPATYEVTTASGGRHLYFESELSGRFPARLAEGIDIKDFGDYVVGPGSEIDGAGYNAANRATRVAIPVVLDALVGDGIIKTRSRVDATPLTELDTAAAISRATEWLEHHAPDHGTYAVACRLKDFGVSEDKATELMLEHWPPAAAKGEEHVSFRVGNAFRYGQNAPGVASAEAEFDAVEIDVKPAPIRKGLFFERWEDAVLDAERPYLVEDLADAGSMVVTYGDSNTGKSYVALDMAFHVALGRDWIGRKTQAGLVVYVAAEGREGFRRRVIAFRQHYKTDNVPFALVPCPIDLQSEQANTRALIRLVNEAEEAFGQKCVMVVIDTLARAMAGGDENTATDMGRFVGHCDRIRAATGATVHIIHHTGKDKSKGARGSSALRAATDTEIEIANGTLSVVKQRDMAPATPSGFSLRPVEIGQRSNGKPVTACVVEWRAATEFEERVSPMALKFHEILADAQALRPDKADTWDDWIHWSTVLLRTIHSKPPSDSYFRRLKVELVNAGKIEETQKDQWLARE